MGHHFSRLGDRELLRGLDHALVVGRRDRKAHQFVDSDEQSPLVEVAAVDDGHMVECPGGERPLQRVGQDLAVDVRPIAG